MLPFNNLKFDFIAGAIILLLVVLMIYNHRKRPLSEANGKQGLGVKDLIERVKAELVETELNQVKQKQAALFHVKEFDLEINFIVGSRNTASGEVDFEVVTVGGNTEISSQKIQKITLHMTVVPPTAHEINMSDSPLTQPVNPIIIPPPPDK